MEGETLLGYIDNLVSFGIIAPKRRSLILTNKRLLIVNADSVSSTAASAGAAYFLGAFGRGLGNKLAESSVKETTEKLASSNFDDILKSNPDNIGLSYEEVQKVEIDRGHISISTSSGKSVKYGLANPDVKNKKGNAYETYVSMLKSALGESKVVAK